MIENVECVAIDLFTKVNLKFCFVYICMSLTAASNAEIVASICTILHNYFQVCYPVYIVGDYNLPYINWNILSNYGGSQLIVNFCIHNSLTLLITESTHYTNGYIFNLLLCNFAGFKYLKSHCISAPLSNTCDHYSINF